MKKEVAIIGGGPSALMLAAFLDEKRFEITIYEKNKTVGRKFLVAGDGGFNLTHAEIEEDLIMRYTPSVFLKAAISFLNNEALRKWLNSVDVPTFVGSSNRVFPEKGIKPITVLNNILKFLKRKNINFEMDHKWLGWNIDNHLVFENNKIINPDYVVYALGGGSWKVTGSDGGWLKIFKEKGIKINPFMASNCAFQIDWPISFLARNEGKPLKNIAASCNTITQKGEAVITKFGIEGNSIYALSGAIQKQLKTQGFAIINLDLKPVFSESKLLAKLSNSNEKNNSACLKKEIKLSSVQFDLLKSQLTKDEFLDIEILAKRIKNLELKIITAAPIDEAISTTGGIQLSEVDANFEFLKIKNHFCIGEMLEWDAPTGGYLLQACFSMGAFLANHLNEKVITS